MRLKKFSEILSRKSEISKSINKKEREIEKLVAEIEKLVSYENALEGVYSYNGFPLTQTMNGPNIILVESPAEDVSRFARVESDGDTFNVFTQKNQTAKESKITAKNQKAALRIARDYVSGNAKSKAKDAPEVAAADI